MPQVDTCGRSKIPSRGGYLAREPRRSAQNRSSKKGSRITLVGIDFLGYLQFTKRMLAYDEIYYAPRAFGLAYIVFRL